MNFLGGFISFMFIGALGIVLVGLYRARRRRIDALMHAPQEGEIWLIDGQSIVVTRVTPQEVQWYTGEQNKLSTFTDTRAEWEERICNRNVAFTGQVMTT